MSADKPCPCLCGCPCHVGRGCEACGCTVYAPDYVAGTKARGDPMTKAYEARLRALSSEMARQLGHEGRPGRGSTAADGRPVRRCSYCRGHFRASGAREAVTCSGACRQALSVALAYEDDVDILPGICRRTTFSKERAAATGYGLMTTTDAVRADLRARRWVRIFGGKREAA